MERRLLVFDVGEDKIVAGAFIGEQLESVLNVPREGEWQQWIEEFAADHLATGPCAAIASQRDDALEKIAATLQLDLQVTHLNPTLAGLQALYPSRQAIAVEIGPELRFDAVEKGTVVVTLLAPGLPAELPEIPQKLRGASADELAAAGHACQAVGTIERTAQLLRQELPEALVIATGSATSELSSDPFNVALREQLSAVTDELQPELRLIGLYASAGGS